MESSSEKLHILFFPLMAPGHMIPTTDMARVFARHGVKATIVTTPMNAPLFAKAIGRDEQAGHDVSMTIIKFPSAEVGLPEGCENRSSVTSKEMSLKFIKATRLLQEPFEEVLKELRPHCVVADVAFPWATEAASKLGIPRLIFHGFSLFALCAMKNLMQNETHKRVSSDSEPFFFTNFPHRIEFTRQKLPDFLKEGCEEELVKLREEMLEADKKSYGVVVNSFQELEPDYSEFYKKVFGMKAWNVGPVSLCNKNTEDKAQRGNSSSIDEHFCLKWLDLRAPDSVICICFGSMFRLSNAQIGELATAIEASGQDFIWVMKEEATFPEGFEERVKERGLIIKGWAPQVLILDHEAVGGFVTHCGWNSILESVSAGIPMLTWPLAAEQFFNERLVTDLLRIGIPVGSQEWARYPEDRKFSVGKEEIGKAISRLMVGEEGKEIRIRARKFKEMAKRALQEGGSSYRDLEDLLQELKIKRSSKNH